MATQLGATPTFQRDRAGAEHYYKLSDRPVAYSVELSDMVIADYDESGAVRGIEFVGKQTEAMTGYLEKARKASRGPLARRPKIPS